eukprot:GILK01009933.1.p1 GENE.GILK01009933.1~~GILK01009933.1.p1  ORF type:complete len:416 (-),score=39.24 GILK01009933.1:9-1256(-)
MSLWKLALKHSPGLVEDAHDQLDYMNDKLKEYREKTYKSIADETMRGSTGKRSKQVKPRGAILTTDTKKAAPNSKQKIAPPVSNEALPSQVVPEKILQAVTPNPKQKVAPPVPTHLEGMALLDRGVNVLKRKVLDEGNNAGLPEKKYRKTSSQDDDLSMSDIIIKKKKKEEGAIIVESHEELQSEEDQDGEVKIFGTCGVDITKHDWNSLTPGSWVTGSIIIGYLKCLIQDKRLASQIDLVDPLYLYKINKGEVGTKKFDWNARLWISPLFLNNNHWAVMFITQFENRAGGRVGIYMDPKKPDEVDYTWLKPLTILDERLGVATLHSAVSNSNRQPKTNTTLCGVYICWYMDMMLDIISEAKDVSDLLAKMKRLKTSMQKMEGYRENILNLLLVWSELRSNQRNLCKEVWPNKRI